MEFENQFVGVVLDRFGQDVMLIPKDENHFSMQAQIKVSTQFFGWLAGLGPILMTGYPIHRVFLTIQVETFACHNLISTNTQWLYHLINYFSVRQ